MVVSAMADRRTTETPGLSPVELKAVIEAERSGAPFLYWRDDAGTLQILRLAEDRWRVTVGRRMDADIPLPSDPEVSRAHALLEWVGGQWTVVDDGLSRNGTFVNGSKVLGRQRLSDRDGLCFGQTRLVYREPTDPEAAVSTARANDNPSAIPLSPAEREVLIALCRPVNDSPFATPATNRDIADETFRSVDSVKAHLRVLFDRFQIGDLPQNAKRARLVERVLVEQVLKPRDF